MKFSAKSRKFLNVFLFLVFSFKSLFLLLLLFITPYPIFFYTDEWMTPVSFIRKEIPTSKTVVINGHMWRYINITYKHNPKDLMINAQLPYVNLNVTMKDQKTLNTTVAVSNGKSKHIMVC